MTRGKTYEVTSVARAKEAAKKYRSLRRAISGIQKLCRKALADKNPAELESTITALRVTVRALLKE
jgi:hypothetical protein